MFLTLPVSGQPGWALHTARCPLPHGLPHRSPVTVVAVDAPTRTVTVSDAGSRTWKLDRMQVDCGRAWYLDGVLCHETHPKAVLHLRHTLLALRERMRMEKEELHGSPTWWQDDVDRTRWYLSRNGHDPDEPPPPDSQPPVLTGAPRG